MAPEHINWLELMAAFLTLKFFQGQVAGADVKVHMDNTTVVAYINHQGGTVSQSLCRLTVKLWVWCLVRSIQLCMPIQGERNDMCLQMLSSNKVAPTE